MPIPKPRAGESEDDFIGRCMADETMQTEYPEEDQRAAICYGQFETERIKNRLYKVWRGSAGKG